MEQYMKLRRDFEGLEKYCSDLLKAHQRLEKLLRLSQQRRKEWEKYKGCEYCRKQGSPREENDQSTGPGSVLRPASPPNIQHVGLERKAHEKAAELAHSSEPSHSLHFNVTDRTSSSQDTGEQISPAKPQGHKDDYIVPEVDTDAIDRGLDHNGGTRSQEQTSSPPVVVAARPVKRKRRGESMRPIAKRIKDEPLSSPPAIVLSKPVSHESMDLDNTGQHIMTPRKLRESCGSREPSHESTILSEEASGQETPDLLGKNQGKRRLDLGTVVRDFAQMESPWQSRKILRPRDPNARILPRKVESKRQTTHSRRDQGLSNIALIAEDGLSMSQPPRTPSAVSENHRNRLQNLLRDRSPEKPPLCDSPNAPATPTQLVSTSSGTSYNSAKGKDTPYPTAKSGKNSRSMTPRIHGAPHPETEETVRKFRNPPTRPRLIDHLKTPLNTTAKAPDSTSRTPYRSLPTSLLTPSHFKPNPP